MWFNESSVYDDGGKKPEITPQGSDAFLKKKWFGSFLQEMGLGLKSESLDFDELNSRNGWKLYDKVNQNGVLEQSWIDQSSFKSTFTKDIPQIDLNVDAKEYALYSVIAEEGNFCEEEWKLYVSSYWGMNVRHSVVLKMLNEIMQNVTVDEKWNFHGIWKIKIDIWSSSNNRELNIDFDNNIITPPIFLRDNWGKASPITSEYIKRFLNYYLLPQNGNSPLAVKTEAGYKINDQYNPDGIIIMNRSRDAKTLTHEIHHWLFTWESQYRRVIYDRVKTTDMEQRDCAVISAATGYDILDPDMENINKNIVIDEMYNAFANEWLYDYNNCINNMTAFADVFCKKYNIKLDFGKYDSIDHLGISQEEKETIKDIKEMYGKTMSDNEFLRKYDYMVINQIKSVKFLRTYLQKFEPWLFARIQEARKKLVDWVDNEKYQNNFIIKQK